MNCVRSCQLQPKCRIFFPLHCPIVGAIIGHPTDTVPSDVLIAETAVRLRQGNASKVSITSAMKATVEVIDPTFKSQVCSQGEILGGLYSECACL